MADVHEALEPFIGQLKTVKATRSSVGLARTSSRFLPTSWCWGRGSMTPVPKQAKKPLGHDNARESSSAARWASFTPSTSGTTQRDMSAALPTQLDGFPSKTTEFGYHLVHQRAAFYKQKGPHLQSSFLISRLLSTALCQSSFWRQCQGRPPGCAFFQHGGLRLHLQDQSCDPRLEGTAWFLPSHPER